MIIKEEILEIYYEERDDFGDSACLTVWKNNEIIKQVYDKDAKNIYKKLTNKRK